MITEAVKNQVIAKLKLNTPHTELAEEYEIPLPLVKEWATKMTGTDLIGLQANMHAINKLASGDIMPPSEQQEKLLKSKIEEVAIEITNEISLTVVTGDLVRAKTLQLCADTVTKLYNALITKTTADPNAPNPDGQSISLFKNLLRD